MGPASPLGTGFSQPPAPAVAPGNENGLRCLVPPEARLGVHGCQEFRCPRRSKPLTRVGTSVQWPAGPRKQARAVSNSSALETLRGGADDGSLELPTPG